MAKPIINSFDSLAPLLIQQYERYLPSAFDNGMSMLQKVNMVIDYLDKMGTTNNALIDQWNQVMLWVNSDGLTDSVNEQLDEWSKDGTIEKLLNDELFYSLNDTISKKVDKTYVDTLTSSLVSGSPKGVYSTVSALQSAFPTGNSNIYVVSADGKWYYWSGSSWIAGNVYQGINLADLSLKTEQIAKENILPLDLYNGDSINLFDKTKASVDSFVGNDGVITTLTGYSYSDLIPVIAEETYVIDDDLSSQGGFYDNNRNWLAKIPTAIASPLGGYIVTIPATPVGIKYMRINTPNKSVCMVVRGNKLPTSYYEYGEKKLINWLQPKLDVLPSNIITMENMFGVVGSNMFDKTKITTGKYYDNNGSLLDSTIINSSDYIPVIPKGNYSVAKGYSTQGAMFDKSMNYIGAIPHPASSTGISWNFSIPANCYYVRLSVTNADLNTFMLVSGNSYPSSYSPYGVTVPWLRLSSNGAISKWASKKWGVIGDSITENNFRSSKNYHDYIADKIGCSVTNYGVSGTGWRTPSSGGALPIYSRVSSMSADLDLVTVFAGTNDWGQTGTPFVLGTMGDTATSTFYGAVDNVIKQLVAKYPLKTIAVFTPLQRSIGFIANGSGFTLEQVADAIINVCNRYGVPVLDLYRNNNLNVWDSVGNTTYFTPSGANIPTGSESADGLHPNDNGHKIIADKIMSFINSL